MKQLGLAASSPTVTVRGNGERVSFVGDQLVAGVAISGSLAIVLGGASCGTDTCNFQVSVYRRTGAGSLTLLCGVTFDQLYQGTCQVAGSITANAGDRIQVDLTNSTYNSGWSESASFTYGAATYIEFPLTRLYPLSAAATVPGLKKLGLSASSPSVTVSGSAERVSFVSDQLSAPVAISGPLAVVLGGARVLSGAACGADVCNFQVSVYRRAGSGSLTLLCGTTFDQVYEGTCQFAGSITASAGDRIQVDITNSTYYSGESASFTYGVGNYVEFPQTLSACGSEPAPQPCVERWTCSGSTWQAVYRIAGTVCRASAGPCDRTDLCDGASSACPADAFRVAGTTCRAAAGPCDAAEVCSGTSGACPADGFKAAATVCRAAAGPCDQAEVCSGSSAACPADAFMPATTVCRASAGVCDLADRCTGSGPACPADGFVPPGTSCSATAACFCTAGLCRTSSRAYSYDPAGNATQVRSLQAACPSP